MQSRNNEFKTLSHRALHLYNDSAHSDAAALFKRAFQTSGGSAQDRLKAKIFLGECLYYLGQYIEGLACLGEAYSATKDQPEFHELAYLSFCAQIECYRSIQKIEQTETHVSLHKRMELINEGLNWLLDIGREEWQHGLLLEKAHALFSLGQKEQALDVAEQGYRLRKKFGYPGHYLGCHAQQVIEYARTLGQYERSFQVLEEMEGNNESPVIQVLLLLERVRLLYAMNPPQYLEALHTARRLVRLTNEIQSPREKFLAYVELAYCAVAVCSFSESRDALQIARQLVLEDQTLNRSWLLREARNSFQRVRKLLSGAENKVAIELCQILPEWIEEIKQTLKALKK